MVCKLACLSIESECEKPKMITNCAHLIYKGRETVLNLLPDLFLFIS